MNLLSHVSFILILNVFEAKVAATDFGFWENCQTKIPVFIKDNHQIFLELIKYQ
jgi:hypothetical protein